MRKAQQRKPHTYNCDVHHIHTTATRMMHNPQQHTLHQSKAAYSIHHNSVPRHTHTHTLAIQHTPQLGKTVQLNVTLVKHVLRGVAHTDTAAYTVGGRGERATYVALLHGGKAEGL